MNFICPALCALNLCLSVYLFWQIKKPHTPLTQEEEEQEADRKAREKRLNEMFDYNP